MDMPPHSSLDNDRHRLAERLSLLRNSLQPKLSQTLASAYFFLSPVTGHRAIRRWEANDAVPQASRRGRFMLYLWCGLGLSERPQEFTKLWELVVSAWDWLPLSREEWQELRQCDCVAEHERVVAWATEAESRRGTTEDDGDDSDEPPAESGVESVTTSYAATATTRRELASVEEHATHDSVQTPSKALTTAAGARKRLPDLLQRWWLLYPLLILAIGLGYWVVISLTTPDLNISNESQSQTQTVVADPPLTEPSLPVDEKLVLADDGCGEEGASHSSCQPATDTLNLDYENENSYAPWQVIEECPVTIQSDAGAARHGQRYLVIEKSGRCYSLFLDIGERSDVGDVRQFSLWVKTEKNQRVGGRLVLWSIGETDSNGNEFSFIVNGDTWHCVQVNQQVENEGHAFWRGELYFTTENVRYFVDSAYFGPEGGGGCPNYGYYVSHYELIPGTNAVPGATISGQLRVSNPTEQPGTESQQLYYWLSDGPQGKLIHSDAFGAMSIAPLAARTMSDTEYFNLRLPLDAKPNMTYYLFLAMAGGTDATHEDGSGPVLLPIEIGPCASDTLFCDVPANYWAKVEIEAWYHRGITTGCRSDAQPYYNLPFCTNQLLTPEALAVSLVRLGHGVNYQPVTPYRGIYADVPEYHARALWIEEFDDRFGSVERSNCSQPVDQRLFCPDRIILRRDLLQYVAHLLELDVEPSARDASHYIDIEDDGISTIADELWARGIVPDQDPSCPNQGFGPMFCPDAPAHRVDMAVWFSRALGMVDPPMPRAESSATRRVQ